MGGGTGGASPARRAALEVVRRTFEHGAYADRAFAATAERRGLRGRDRAHAQRLAYGAIQRSGTVDALIERLAGRGVDELDGPVLAALRVGLYEVLYAGGTPDHAAVDQAVGLARWQKASRAAAGVVNAVLRRALREREPLLSELADEGSPAAAALAHSYPEWMVRLWWRELGREEALSLMRAMNEPAEMALRANTLRVEPEPLLAELREAGEQVRRPPAGRLPELSAAFVCDGPVGPELASRIDRREALVQSRGSQSVAATLDPRPGERVLDLCAGPGLKTTALAASMRDAGEVVAVELHASRARQVRELCARTGASCVRVLKGDALELELGSGYDRVLVDPPCSDLGTLASRPDARWRKTEEDVERLSTLQRGLLERAGLAVRPGGTVVYSTCTISRRENEEVVGAAGPARSGLELRSSLQLRPDRDGTTGFFVARLQAREGGR